MCLRKGGSPSKTRTNQVTHLHVPGNRGRQPILPGTHHLTLTQTKQGVTELCRLSWQAGTSGSIHIPPSTPPANNNRTDMVFRAPPPPPLSLKPDLNVQRAESRKNKRKTRKRHDVAHAKHYVLRAHTHGRERQSARASTRGTTPRHNTRHTHTQTRDMIQKGAALAGQPLFQAPPPPSPTLRQMGSHRHMPRSPPSCSG